MTMHDGGFTGHNNGGVQLGLDFVFRGGKGLTRYMSSFFDCIKYNLYIFFYMCFLISPISPYVRLRVPAYLGTRGRSKLAFFL